MANLTKQEYMEMQKETVAQSRTIYAKALNYCPTLFTPEVYPQFLAFLAEWNHYPIIDAVLLFMQYPNASYIAGFKKWQGLSEEQGYASSHMIIKPDQRKKAISLLIPFSFSGVQETKGRDEEFRFLTYKSILVYDVSQINDIQVPPHFNPKVPIHNLEFPVFIALCRQQFQEELGFTPGNPEAGEFRFCNAYLKGHMIYYLDSLSDTEKAAAVLREIVRYFVKKTCRDEKEREFVSLSLLYTLFHYFQYSTEHLVFSSVAVYQEMEPEKLFRLLYYIHTFTQKLIYEFYNAYTYFLSVYSDSESNRILTQYREDANVLSHKETGIYFDFMEINILIQNMDSSDKEGFIKFLHHVRENTKDAMLLHSIGTLIGKLLDLTERQFQLLYQDMKEGNISTVDGYLLPFI